MRTHSALERLATNSVVYAIRIFVLILLLVFVVSAFSQTQFQVACQDGYCVMRESDLERLQVLINAMYERIMELQAKTGCT